MVGQSLISSMSDVSSFNGIWLLYFLSKYYSNGLDSDAFLFFDFKSEKSALLNLL